MESEESTKLDIDEAVLTERQYFKATSDFGKIDVSSLNSEEIVAKRKELQQKVDGMYHCTKCEYVTKYQGDIKKHTERHLVGLFYKCKHCRMEFSSFNSLRYHKSIAHRT